MLRPVTATSYESPEPVPTATEPSASRRRWYRRRFVVVLGWLATAGLVFYTLLRLFGLETGWILVVIVAFAPYVTLVGLLGVGLLALVRNWWALGVSALCVVLLALMVTPRAIATDTAGTSSAYGPSLRVMAANIAIGEGDEGTLLEWAKEYDIEILAVQEMTELNVDRFTELGIDELYPHQVVETGWAAEGSAIYSRYPLERLPDLEPDGIFHQPMATVSIPDGPEVNVMSVHTAAPQSSERVRQWERDFEQFPSPSEDNFWILAGDFNATLDHRNMRDLLDEGFADAASATGDGWSTTWHTESRWARGLLSPPPITLDRVVIDERGAINEFEILDEFGSDHRPVMAEIRLP